MILGQFLIGSQNYGLDLPQSDRDYYTIVMPNITQLFSCEKITRKADEWNMVQDIREFSRLLLKGNPNYWEMLYSTDKTYYFPFFKEINAITKKHSGAVLRENWSTFTKASYGKVLTGINKEFNLKNISRFLYFYEMNKRLYEANGEMSISIWRGLWVEKYKQIRLENKITPGLEKEVEKAKSNWNFELTPEKMDEDVVSYINKNYINLFKILIQKEAV